MRPVGVHMARQDPARPNHGLRERDAGAEHHARCDPGSLWTQTGHWIWNAPGNAWPLPVAGADSSGICSLSLQVGTSAPIADPSLPAPSNSSWQECHSQRAGQRR